MIMIFKYNIFEIISEHNGVGAKFCIVLEGFMRFIKQFHKSSRNFYL